MTVIPTAFPKLNLHLLDGPEPNWAADSRQDIARQVHWMNDPEIVKYSEQRLITHTVETEREYVRSFTGPGRFFFKIMYGNEHIGNITAQVTQPDNVADVGIVIGEKRFWGKGYGAHSWKTACDWLLSAQGGAVRKIEAGCMAKNEGMRKIMKRTRMRVEGRRVHHFMLNHMPVDLVLYGRIR